MPPKNSTTRILLGSTIRAVRKERGYTQESFAAKAEIDRSYYGAIERGEFNLTVNKVLQITDGLGLTAADLFERAGL
jgi:transcriptional regulator with XRE-family HTH domain